MSAKPNIRFYTAQSPNGHKIAITLEELGLPYETVPINMAAIEHKEPWFMGINPNGRIPALSDTLPDGTPINLFESGSIQQYLADRYDLDHKISYPRGTIEFYQTTNWVSSSVVACWILTFTSSRLTSFPKAVLSKCRNRPDAGASEPLRPVLSRHRTATICHRSICQ